MQISFQECNWSQLYIWLEFTQTPSPEEQEYLQLVLESWYTLGVLGGFNATALPIQETADEDLSYWDYPPVSNALPALMHNMGSVEFLGNLARCWFDLGTADPLALDVLINALSTLDKDYSALQQLVIGGDNEAWPIPNEDLEDD